MMITEIYFCTSWRDILLIILYCLLCLENYIYSMTIKIILLIIFLILILWFIIFAVFLLLGPMITGFKKAPYVPSFGYHLRIMKKYLKLKKWATIVDLWCGDGKALRFFREEFWLKGVWYDLNPFVIWYGRLLNLLHWCTHVRLIRADLKKAQLSRYDYIYIYLWPSQLISLEDRMFTHMWEKTIIVSNSFTFGKHKPFEIICDEHTKKKVIYLYKI